MDAKNKGFYQKSAFWPHKLIKYAKKWGIYTLISHNYPILVQLTGVFRGADRRGWRVCGRQELKTFAVSWTPLFIRDWAEFRQSSANLFSSFNLKKSHIKIDKIQSIDQKTDTNLPHEKKERACSLPFFVVKKILKIVMGNQSFRWSFSLIRAKNFRSRKNYRLAWYFRLQWAKNCLFVSHAAMPNKGNINKNASKSFFINSPSP